MNQNSQRNSGSLNRKKKDKRRPSKEASPNQSESLTEPPVPLKRTYNVVFFATLDEAHQKTDELLNLAKEVDQLNIVIRQEANMDDPKLCQYGKVFAGQAWALIHDRRVAEGWYNQPQ